MGKSKQAPNDRLHYSRRRARLQLYGCARVGAHVRARELASGGLSSWIIFLGFLPARAAGPGEGARDENNHKLPEKQEPRAGAFCSFGRLPSRPAPAPPSPSLGRRRARHQSAVMNIFQQSPATPAGGGHFETRGEPVVNFALKQDVGRPAGRLAVRAQTNLASRLARLAKRTRLKPAGWRPTKLEVWDARVAKRADWSAQVSCSGRPVGALTSPLGREIASQDTRRPIVLAANCSSRNS